MLTWFGPPRASTIESDYYLHTLRADMLLCQEASNLYFLAVSADIDTFSSHTFRFTELIISSRLLLTPNAIFTPNACSTSPVTHNTKSASPHTACLLLSFLDFVA